MIYVVATSQVKPDQREAFIKRFWELRDPFPQTPRNELKEVWDERVVAARQRFGSLAEERARMLLLNGEPAHVLRSRCSEVLLPLEVWTYDRTGSAHARFALVFYQPLGAVNGPYTMWRPGEGISDGSVAGNDRDDCASRRLSISQSEPPINTQVTISLRNS